MSIRTIDASGLDELRPRKRPMVIVNGVHEVWQSCVVTYCVCVGMSNGHVYVEDRNHIFSTIEIEGVQGWQVLH